MIKALLNSLFVIVIIPAIVYAQQDSIRQRVIFIGDAGEQNKQQNRVISSATEKVIPGKTTVIYLGDNIYPRGIGLPGSKEEEHTKEILRTQYQQMRSAGAAVYFLPGNHDWDRMGKQGLQKIKAQWKFVASQQDPLLQLLPPDGCSGPIEINLSKELVVVVFDSEWWLFPHDKNNTVANCDCNTKDESIDRFRELSYENRNKMVLLADHHPFKSYGHHGGYFNWKDHLFPFTAINKNLYIPLPVIGSLYPLLRTLFPNREDAGHSLYKEMVKKIDGVFDTLPNLVHVSGHEHGMQFIKKGSYLQVVSGAGAKKAYVKKGKYALFACTVPGFVTVDQLPDNNIRFTYYTQQKGGSILKISYTYVQPYVQ